MNHRSRREVLAGATLAFLSSFSWTQSRADSLSKRDASADNQAQPPATKKESTMRELKLSTVGHLVLGVSNLDASLEFYSKTLGMELAFKTDGLAFLKSDKVMLVLSKELAVASKNMVGATEVVFTVESVADAHRQLRERGVEFINEPRQVTDKEWAATFVDPNGHRLSLFGPQESA